jgi:hypothetical protein
MHRSHALARYIARSICTLTVLKFVRKGWQAHCFTGLILTRLASSLPISLLAHRSNKIIHTISYETCGDQSPSCSTNTLLETRIHVHIYTYIYPKEKLDVHIRVSTCSYKLGCTHTSMRRVHVRASLNALVWHQRSTGEVRVLPQKKKPLSFHPEFRPASFVRDLRCSVRRTWQHVRYQHNVYILQTIEHIYIQIQPTPHIISCFYSLSRDRWPLSNRQNPPDTSCFITT